MTEEKASDLQINAIMKMKLHPAPWTLTKAEAWKLMDDNKRGVSNGKVDAPVERPQDNKPKSANGHTAMYVSYAKDLFCAMVDARVKAGDKTAVENCMKESIELIKQAKEAFE